MRIFRALLIIVLTISNIICTYGQNKNVQGDIDAGDTVDLSILNIYPNSFPTISVIFKAEKRNGAPLWDLTRQQVIVKENDKSCGIVSLDQISKTKPINLGIVIDHSGSMGADYTQLYDSFNNPNFSFDKNGDIILPKGYTTPIDNAKSAVKNFISSFNFDKDNISLIGFSSIVDLKLPLTKDLNKIHSSVDSLRADASTALYDAMISGLYELDGSNGVNVLVAITDGYDNSSNSNWLDVINKANELDIPIYIIGLGEVNTDTLLSISESTQGKFYFTKSSTSLDSIYLDISIHVQAFYNLIYNSNNLSSSDVERQVEISFDIDSIFLVSKPSNSVLPNDVILLLQQNEKEKEYLQYGGIVVAILLSTSLVFYFRRRKQKSPYIIKIYPNPSNGIIHIKYRCNKGTLKIIDSSGKTRLSFQITGIEQEFNLSSISNGYYFAIISDGITKSNTKKLIIQR